ncbi:MAG: serine/threonine protein kinase [Myxococcales bacterium]|nr:serine/threonine protein kinase [Myxococcales bacterium]
MTRKLPPETLPEVELSSPMQTVVDAVPIGGEPEGPDPLIGTWVAGHYLVDALIAQGGMGRVYMATSPERGTVALKTLLPQYSGNHQVAARFEREVRTLQEAQCPHVVRMYESGHLEDGRAFFVMEYVDGVALDVELERVRQRMPVDRALRITLQLCAALVPAHELGIVHRDLKPENLVLCEINGMKDVLKVLDFGIAKSDVTGRRGITDAGTVLGTPTYMSPEQCRGKQLDDRSDIYSLGVMLYELLCGEPPFLAEEPWDVIRMHLEEPPLPPSRRSPPVRIPPTLEWMLLCCLHKEPEKRFQTMREVHEEMGHIAHALGVELPPTAR